MVPTRADRSCYVLYFIQTHERAWEHLGQRTIAQQNATKDVLSESPERSEVEAAFERTPDPTAGNPAAGKSVTRVINLFGDDLVGTGGNEMKQRVLTRLTKEIQVDSDDWNDTTFTGQRIRWTQDSKNEQYIEVSEEKTIEELEDPSGTKHEGRPPVHSFNAHNVQTSSGTDKLTAE